MEALQRRYAAPTCGAEPREKPARQRSRKRAGMEVADGMTTELMIAPAGSLGQRRTSSRSVNAAEAIEGYLEAVHKHDDPIPIRS